MSEENPYTDKVKFHYAPLPVQIVMAAEDAGLCHVLDTADTPTNAESFSEHCMGKPFGLSDSAVYIVAFGSLLYAVYMAFLV
ncbi:MAG: hypothetical protein WC408_03305 [Candidatus Micrarchaeia archaeon]